MEIMRTEIMRKTFLASMVGALVCFLAPFSQAQLLSVDINGTTRSDTTAPGFTRWDMSPDLALTTTRRAVTRAFTNFPSVLDDETGLIFPRRKPGISSAELRAS
jgi:TctA family transporter